MDENIPEVRLLLIEKPYLFSASLHHYIFGNGMKGLSFSQPLYISLLAVLDAASLFLVCRSYSGLPVHSPIILTVLWFILEYGATGIGNWQFLKSVHDNEAMTDKFMKADGENQNVQKEISKGK